MARDPKHKNAQKKFRKKNDRCVVCGCSENLETHHLREYSFQGSCNPENFITLCHFHHDAVHKGEISIISILK